MIKNSKGMTLVEIMVVLAILGGLAAMLVSTVMSRLSTAKIKQAKIQISEIKKYLDIYYTDCNAYPTDEQGLDALITSPGAEACPQWGPEPYMKKRPKDPWNREFIYELRSSSPTIISLGKDGREGGEGENKDISSEEE